MTVQSDRYSLKSYYPYLTLTVTVNISNKPYGGFCGRKTSLAHCRDYSTSHNCNENAPARADYLSGQGRRGHQRLINNTGTEQRLIWPRLCRLAPSMETEGETRKGEPLVCPLLTTRNRSCHIHNLVRCLYTNSRARRFVDRT